MRFPSIFSKLGDVDIIDNSQINCCAEKCGLSGSPTRVLETFENQRGKRKCKFIQFSSIGNKNGMIIGLKPDFIKIYDDDDEIIKNVL